MMLKSKLPHYFLIVIMGLLQYKFLLVFFELVDPKYFTDLGAYQSLIDGMSGDGLQLDMFSFASIQQRTLDYHEYIASLVFEVAAFCKISSIELHSLSIATISVATSILQLKLDPKKSLALLLTLSCPFIFSNLFLGNTRQIWGCALILFFYWKTPLFHFFQRKPFKFNYGFFRLATFSLLILMTHVGSAAVFVIVLIFDYIVAKFKRHRTIDLSANKIVLIGIFILFGSISIYLIINSVIYQVFEIKASYYLEESLPPYPYLTGIFTYLVIGPLIVDCLFLMRKSLAIEEVRRILLLTLLVLCISWLLPSLSHTIDRVLTALFFLVYVKRFSIGLLGLEFKVFIPARFIALVFYLFSRAV